MEHIALNFIAQFYHIKSMWCNCLHLFKKKKKPNTKQPTQQSKQKTPKGPLLTWGFGARGTWFVRLSWPVIDVDATGNRFHLRSLWFPRDASWHCEKAVRPRIKSWVIQCLLLWFLRVQIHWHTSCWQWKLSANFLFSGGGVGYRKQSNLISWPIAAAKNLV